MQYFWVVDEFVEKLRRFGRSHQGRNRFLSATLAPPLCPFRDPVPANTSLCPSLSNGRAGHGSEA